MYGDRRPYPALATVNPEAADRLVRSPGVLWTDQAQLAGHPAVRKRVEQIIEDRNGRLQSYARIKKFAVLPTELTEEAGEVTPSQKLRRKRVAGRYADVLESLYEPHPERQPARFS